MSEINLTEIKDFQDGEVRINVSCDFTIFVPPLEKKEILNRIHKSFEEVMMKYAI